MQEWPSSFRDRLSIRIPGTAKVLRILATGGFTGRGRPKKEGRLVAQRHMALPKIRKSQTCITWVGHATTLIRTGGKAFVTDPVWSPKLPGNIPRITEPGIAWDDLPHIDGVLVSHNHYDHMDAPTLKRFERTTRIFCPANTGKWFARRGFKRIVEMDWWVSRSFDGIGFTFVPAQHWSRRGLFDMARSLWGGWVIRPEGQDATFFAGDTGYGPHFKEIGNRFRGIGAAIMPVGAYEPRWFMQPMHVNPEEAVQAALDLRAKRFVPMHYGTFVLSREPTSEPPARARAAWIRAGKDPEDFWGLAIGESRVC